MNTLNSSQKIFEFNQSPPSFRTTYAKKLLNVAAYTWVVTAVIGQLFFALYVTVEFLFSGIKGNFSEWNKQLPTGFVPGDTLINLALILHMYLAVGILIAGGLQLWPRLRNNRPMWHRWIGRFYITAVILTACGGLILTWGDDGGVGDLTQHIGITGNAILILVFATLAGFTAYKKQFHQHRWWALRLYLVVNGVWFFRIGLSLWLMIHQEPVGFDPETFTGPTLSVISFASYLFPLFMLELYRLVQLYGQTTMQYLATTTMVLLTLATLAGSISAAMIIWLPEM